MTLAPFETTLTGTGVVAGENDTDVGVAQDGFVHVHLEGCWPTVHNLLLCHGAKYVYVYSYAWYTLKDLGNW